MIGGEHYLSPPRPVADNFGEMLENSAEHISFFSTGRDALASLLMTLSCGTMHLPDLICHSVYQACHYAGKEVRTYRIESDLINTDIELDPAQACDSCILVMHYFGITNEHLISRAKSLSMTIISDVTHMLFNRDQMDFLSGQSDYLVASLRKSGPFPDGGFISSRHHPVPYPSRGQRMDFFSLRAAGLLSRGFSSRQDFSNDENFVLLRKAENLLDKSQPGDFECSYLSKELLRTISVDDSSKKIIKNLSILASRLVDSCRTVSTPSAPSPYFLCLLENQEKRDLIRATLAQHRYFCPIHWDTSQMPQPSPLSDRIFSIPCDARYAEVDMKSVAEIINSCLTH